jgi:hypothetical protein
MTKRLLGQFTGKPISLEWDDVHVFSPREWEEPGLSAQERQAAKELKKGRTLGDFTWLGGAEGGIVLNERAMEVLESLIREYVEVIPLDHEGRRLHLLNVLSEVDCLDERRSELSRLRNGRILRIIRPVFRDIDIEPVHIFKLPQPKIPIFVSDTFKREVDTNELTGLTWEK